VEGEGWRVGPIGRPPPDEADRATAPVATVNSLAYSCESGDARADALHQSFTRPPADTMAKEMNEFGRTSGAPRQRGRYLRHLPRERLPLASLVSTLPALDA